ncbi:hypothetical protein NA57DRAFT_57579 [Rhizodiscina lignyota]|uniref:Uncharacterized protein n=1 Tax=Rhizodiscina lignyota TaxID=1504668 RepID=A0A9P4ICR5_9PEZI|nr:hypothetical protein NA57DRAFT_57579 [Rhizodiscina lignyota]
MAPKASKRAPPSTSASTKSSAPPPFTSAPSSLAPFLSGLNRNHIYITHIDTFPAAYKRRIFYIPVILNAVFALLVLLRIYFAIPKYASILLGTFGYESQDAVDIEKSSWGTLAWIVIGRVAMFMFDFVLIRFVGSWPWSFFIDGLLGEDEENPCTWRWKLGFRDREPVMRISRSWGKEELFGGVKKGGESPFFRTKIMPAVHEEWVKSKTGYLMMGKEWDLEFGGMVQLQKMIDAKDIGEADIDGLALGWWGQEDKSDGQWVAWKFREAMESDEERDEYGMTEEEGQRQMSRLRDRLAAMGKEGLFFRMIELVQYEGSTPEGFSPERQAQTLEKIKQLFADQGLDFENILNELGVDLPGMSARH